MNASSQLFAFHGGDNSRGDHVAPLNSREVC